ncbi:hypothetical protein [Stenotrophomonas sp.]|uniref:hypothetical protein n=1 Tax=Stenotrophomonas sp. TaxID=69392 RepID=UPI002FCB686F
MSPIRIAVVALLLTATAAHAAERVRYLDLVNRAHDRVTAVAVAPAGSGAFQAKDIDAVPGGGGATTVGIADAGCRYDLQVQFGNGRSALYPNVDVCRGGRLVISAMPRDARYARQAAQPVRQLAGEAARPR